MTTFTLSTLSLAIHLEVHYRRYLWTCGVEGCRRPQSRAHWLDSNLEFAWL